MWRKALFDLDRKSSDGSVLIADFDKGLDDVRSMDRKVLLLEELVFDPSRRVVVLSKVSLRGLIDSVRLSAGASSDSAGCARSGARQMAAHHEGARHRGATPAESVVGRAARTTFACREVPPCERESHPDVRRVCDDLLQSDAVAGGRLSRAQAFDELVERTAQCYRGLWMSCSEDEKVVLGHVARHGLANSSARSIVRQLLGRGILHADPALRPMNETFRHFILTRECYEAGRGARERGRPERVGSASHSARRGRRRRGSLPVCDAEGAVQRHLRSRHGGSRFSAGAHSDRRQAGRAANRRARKKSVKTWTNGAAEDVVQDGARDWMWRVSGAID